MHIGTYSKEFFDFHTQSYSNRNIRLEYAQTDRMIQNVQKMSDLKGFFYINHKKREIAQIANSWKILS